MHCADFKLEDNSTVIACIAIKSTIVTSCFKVGKNFDIKKSLSVELFSLSKLATPLQMKTYPLRTPRTRFNIKKEPEKGKYIRIYELQQK